MKYMTKATLENLVGSYIDRLQAIVGLSVDKIVCELCCTELFNTPIFLTKTFV